jgi:hypothetical protein
LHLDPCIFHIFNMLWCVSLCVRRFCIGIPRKNSILFFLFHQLWSDPNMDRLVDRNLGQTVLKKIDYMHTSKDLMWQSLKFLETKPDLRFSVVRQLGRTESAMWGNVLLGLWAYLFGLFWSFRTSAFLYCLHFRLSSFWSLAFYLSLV